MGQMATEPAGVAFTALIRMVIIPFHVTMVLASCFGTMNSPLLFMRWPRCVALLPPQASASNGLISCEPQGAFHATDTADSICYQYPSPG